MILKDLTVLTIAVIGMAASATTITSCSGKKPTEEAAVSADTTVENQPQQKDNDRKGPRGFAIDKSADATLQTMIKEVAPRFRQLTYDVPGKDTKIEYNLFVPEKLDPARKYPLVLFIADASTANKEITLPLTQGYGALVWATPESQSKNPCYVLVPQFKEVATNDDYQHSAEVDDVITLINQLAKDNQIDTSRLYSTGQSMGGMISMYYDVAYPDMFAASIFVDSHWDAATFPELVKHKFIWFIAGDGGKAYPKLRPLEEAAESAKINYTFTEWSAKLPQSQQDEMAATMLEKNEPVNIFEFETGSVLPDGMTEGIDHMYSFDYAYRNSAARDWLFRQKK